MENTKQENLETLIAREKRNLVIEYFQEAWENAKDDGIEAETIAEAMVEGAIYALAEERGDQFAQKLVSMMHQKSEIGDFLAQKTLQ